MTLSDVARAHGVIPAHLAQAMGRSRQFIDQVGKTRMPTFKTLERACQGFRRLGIQLEPYELVHELQRKREAPVVRGRTKHEGT